MSNDLVESATDLLDEALGAASEEQARHYIREAQQLLEGVGELPEPAPVRDED